MTYEFPLRGPLDFDPAVWRGITAANVVVNLALVLGFFAYYFYATNWKLRSKLVLFGFLAGMIGTGVLSGLMFARGLHWEALIPLSVGFLAGLLACLHSGLALATQNPTEMSPRASVVLTLAWFVGVGGSAYYFLIPASDPSSRAPSKISQCKNNMKLVVIGIQNCEEDYRKPIDAVIQYPDRPPQSWRVTLLPFIDQAPIYNIYDFKQPWDSAANIKFSQMQIPVYVCPAVPEDQQRNASGQYYTSYAMVTGPGTAFPDNKGLKPDQFTDGTSNTVLVVEACGQQIVWSKPQDIEKTANNVGLNLPGTRPHQSSGIWSSYHRSRYHDGQSATVAMADGSVRLINKETDQRVLNALLTPSGGEKGVDP